MAEPFSVLKYINIILVMDSSSGQRIKALCIATFFGEHVEFTGKEHADHFIRNHMMSRRRGERGV